MRALHHRGVRSASEPGGSPSSSACTFAWGFNGCHDDEECQRRVCPGCPPSSRQRPRAGLRAPPVVGFPFQAAAMGVTWGHRSSGMRGQQAIGCAHRNTEARGIQHRGLCQLGPCTCYLQHPAASRKGKDGWWPWRALTAAAAAHLASSLSVIANGRQRHGMQRTLRDLRSCAGEPHVLPPLLQAARCQGAQPPEGRAGWRLWLRPPQPWC